MDKVYRAGNRYFRQMTRGSLSEYFTGVGMKLLSPSDTAGQSSSNQHEVGDAQRSRALKRVLGNTPRTLGGGNPFSASYIWMGDDQEFIRMDGELSWYDTRESRRSQRASEWRLYYQTSEVTRLMDAGDHLFLARRPDDTILFIVTTAGSTIASQLKWLFGIKDTDRDQLVAREITGKTDTNIDFPCD